MCAVALLWSRGAWSCVVARPHMHRVCGGAAAFLTEASWASSFPVASLSRNTKAGRGWRGWETCAVKPKRSSETQI